MQAGRQALCWTARHLLRTAPRAPVHRTRSSSSQGEGWAAAPVAGATLLQLVSCLGVHPQPPWCAFPVHPLLPRDGPPPAPAAPPLCRSSGTTNTPPASRRRDAALGSAVGATTRCCCCYQAAAARPLGCRCCQAELLPRSRCQAAAGLLVLALGRCRPGTMRAPPPPSSWREAGATSGSSADTARRCVLHPLPLPNNASSRLLLACVTRRQPGRGRGGKVVFRGASVRLRNGPACW